MSASILVAYTTRYGSTAGVADTVGAELSERGFAAEVRPMGDVSSLEGFDAVVMGAPLYIGSMGSTARGFLKRFHDDLESLPVAVFALGPLSDKEDEVAGCRDQLTKELAKHPWLNPACTEVFGGAMDPGRLHFPDSLLMLIPASPLKDVPATDVRDWTAIRSWAADLPQSLGLA